MHFCKLIITISIADLFSFAVHNKKSKSFYYISNCIKWMYYISGKLIFFLQYRMNCNKFIIIQAFKFLICDTSAKMYNCRLGSHGY